jgi:hypothetical protein
VVAEEENTGGHGGAAIALPGQPKTSEPVPLYGTPPGTGYKEATPLLCSRAAVCLGTSKCFTINDALGERCRGNDKCS